jgi:hypothetical protein
MENPSENDRMVAYCGLVCTECPAFLATKAGDAERIREIAQLWSETYNANVTPEAVWCDGCIEEGRKCGHCGDCEIRACGRDRKVANCGTCADVDGCEKLANFFKMAPHAEKVIRDIAAGRK